MAHDLDREAFQGLGRLCVDAAENCIVPAPGAAGMERIEARFHGNAFDLHRHDTYAIGVTLYGVQRFRYRGQTHQSLPGQIIILHPDELHDGGAGTEDGLRYRMLFGAVPDARLSRRRITAIRRECRGTDRDLRATLLSALGPLNQELDELFVVDFMTQLMQSLARHAGQPAKPVAKTAWRAASLARDYLEENVARIVRSDELEAITGLDRYALSRHFRATFSTSPHRFLVMRRLQRARRMIEADEPLAQIAIAAGFSDQSHFNRHFKKAFGVTPGRWSALTRRPSAANA
ncbi:AraC family transcriptional regulator [Mesorhizobium sp. M0998]|uniref:AraC family transcriptional regulator n=1 Tax=Mesorhizobium sp. M0998 TaxID=2957044 RepID=UPI00333BD754